MLRSSLSLSVRRPVRLSLWSSGLRMLVRVLPICWQSCISDANEALAWLGVLTSTDLMLNGHQPFGILISWQQGHLYMSYNAAFALQVSAASS